MWKCPGRTSDALFAAIVIVVGDAFAACDMKTGIATGCGTIAAIAGIGCCVRKMTLVPVASAMIDRIIFAAAIVLMLIGFAFLGTFAFCTDLPFCTDLTDIAGNSAVLGTYAVEAQEFG